jgi:hypothetical protein
MKIKIIAVCLLCGIIAFSGCKSKRAIVKAPLKEYGADYLVERMTENQLQFNTVSMKANISAKMGKSKNALTLSGTIRIVKDSIIWMSVSPGLGIEAVRLLVTPDSIKFMDRINNKYVLASLDFFKENYQVDVDFNMLQSLLVGNDFNFYEYSKFKAGYDGSNYKLTAQERRKQKKYVRNNNDAKRILVQNTWLNPETFKIEAIQIKALEDMNRKLQGNYSNFITVDGQLVPSKELFELFMKEAEKDNFVASIDINFTKIELNKDLNTSFTIPAKYTPMSL